MGFKLGVLTILIFKFLFFIECFVIDLSIQKNMYYIKYIYYYIKLFSIIIILLKIIIK